MKTIFSLVIGLLKPSNFTVSDSEYMHCIVGASLESLKEICKDECWTEPSLSPAKDEYHPKKEKESNE